MKQILLKTWLIVVCLLVMGGGRAWGTIETGTYTLCTSTSDLEAGAHYIIASGTSGSVNCISNVSNSNNRKIVSATVTDSKIEVASNSTIMTFTLGGSTGVWTFSTDNYAGTNGYLASAASGNNNYCRVISTSTTSTISFSSNAAVITLQPHTSRNILRFNSSSSCFACYSTGQAAVYLYKKATADTRTAVNMTGFSATSTELVKGETTNTSATNDQNNWTASYTYESSNTSVATVSNTGVITAVAKGTTTITASLNIANDDATWKKGATSSKTIDITVNNPSHTAKFSVNGSIDESNNQTVEEGSAITFPTNPEIDDVVFMGWTKMADYANATTAPSDMTKSATMGTDDVTYYAVFATAEEGEEVETKTQTLQYDTWTYSGSTTNKSTYRLFHSGSYIESASFDRSKLSKVIVYGGTFGGDSYNKLTIGDGTNTWKSVTVSGSSQTGTNIYTNGTALSGTGTIRITSNSGSASSNGVRISKIEIFTMEGGDTYSDYCTTVSNAPQPTIILSAKNLNVKVGNTNNTITVDVQENTYEGTLSAESNKPDVATAEIVDGKVAITGVSAGDATITITAPAATGFRANTATISVSVSEKLSAELSFDAPSLELVVGQETFMEPKLSNPHSLPVTYSLVYATPANEGNVATIDAETGKITIANPSLSTETQGAVTVKASTDGDDNYAASEAEYSLVVSRKVTTTSWSNEGAAVEIDSDEIGQLPTASNNGSRNLFYESSNTEVATIDKTGAVTFVAYGTTTITAKTTATAEYAATSATYELTFAPRYTITFDAQAGTCGEVSLREVTAGAGVKLPKATCLDSEWSFAGWAKADCEETTNAPTLYKADTTYKPERNLTLYAVYMTGAAEGEIAFNRVTSLSNIDFSKRMVIISNKENKALTITAGEDEIFNDLNTINVSNGTMIWNVTLSGNVSTFSDCYVNTSGNSNPRTMAVSTGIPRPGTTNPSAIGNKSTSRTNVLWNIRESSVSGCFVISSVVDESVSQAALTVGTINGKTQWGVLNVNDSDGPRDPSVFAMRIYVEGRTTSATYNSNPIATATITLNAACHTEDGKVYGTYSNSSAFIVPETLTVEEVGITDGVLNVAAYETGAVVPANTGVMVHAAEGGDYKVVLSDEDGSSVLENNYLHPSSEPMTGDNLFYRLTMHNGTQIGFWWGAAEGAAFNLSANKAYLAVPKSAESAIRSGAWFGDEGTLTNIEGVAAENNAENAIFNISGQRVIRADKGVYIVNGRKVIR